MSLFTKHPKITIWDVLKKHRLKNFWPSYTPCKKAKNRARLGPKLRWSPLLTVECLCEDANLCRLEVHSIFAILARGVLKTQSNIYDGDFSKNS